MMGFKSIFGLSMRAEEEEDSDKDNADGYQDDESDEKVGHCGA